jgi:hypothetical protein
MKKTILTIVCLLGLLNVNAQTAKIALQHNGFVTLYDADQMENALKASVDGDTIYLNEGTFKGDVIIAKKVSLIGSGAATIYEGAITISIPGSPTLTSHLLDAIFFKNSIIVTQPLNGLKIRKCQFYGLRFNAKTEDITIDRCYSRGGDNSFRLSGNVKKMTMLNSKIWYITGDVENPGDASFVNCNIYYMYNYNSSNYGLCRATYMNCIINSWAYSNSSYHRENTTYVNCLCGQDFYSYSVYQNCWNANNTKIIDNSTTCTFTDDQLRSNGYLGTDGTVVGITGGTTPYTLEPSVPKVTDYTIKVDTQTKKLNVNIKVKAN